MTPIKKGARFTQRMTRSRIIDGVEETTNVFEVTSVSDGSVYYRTVWFDGPQMIGAAGTKIRPDRALLESDGSLTYCIHDIATGWL